MTSIFDQIGGKPAVSAAVDRLYERLLADPVLAPYFTGTGLGVTHDAFDRVVIHLVAALASLGVPGETVAAIGAKVAPLREQIVTAEGEREAA